FPTSMSKLDLHGVLLQGNKLTTYPEFIATQKNLNVLHLIDENISEIPATIATNTKLRSLVLRDLQLSSLPDVFDQLFRISTLDISGNKNITSLPASIQPLQFGNQLSYLHGLYAKNCGFTQIPQEVISSKFVQLNLSGNPLTSVSKADIEAMTKLDCLELNDIPFTSFPVVEKENMRMLSLINTGLTPADVDRTGMPNLYSVFTNSEGITSTYDFLFFTQEQYDAIFASNLAPHSLKDLLK
ncbi:MAG: leucine-rich repeat domain-containing protein, partial [Bacteroidales bacterium]